MRLKAADLAGTSYSNVLDNEQLAALAARVAPSTYGIGATIFRAGESVRHLHVIRKGRVLLYTENDLGDRVVIQECHPGEQFGEISLLDQVPSPFFAIAMEETVLLNLERRDFEELLARYPQLGRELLKSPCRRLRSAFESLRGQSASSIDDRLGQVEPSAMKLARWVTTLAGSWIFFVVFSAIIALWIYLGRGISWPITIPALDPPPHQNLNLVLTTLAAINAPVILVVLNGLIRKNRLKDKRDAENDMRMQMQIARLLAKLDEQQRWVEDHFDFERVDSLETEVARLRSRLEEQRSVFEDRIAQLSRKITISGDERVPAVN